MDNISKGIFLAFIGWASFVCSDILVKLMSERGLLPIEIVLFGGIAGALVSAVFLRKKDKATFILALKQTPFSVLFLALATTSTTYGSINAFALLPMPDIYVFIFTAPVVTFFIARFFLQEPIPKKRWLLAFLCFLGVLIAYYGDLKFSNTQLNKKGLAYVSLVVFGVAFASAFMRKLKLSAALMSFYPSIFVALLAYFMIDKQAYELFLLFANVWYFALPMMFFVGLGKISRSASLNHAPASVIAITHYLQLPLGAIAGFLIWSHLPSFSMILGGAIIVFCGIYLIYSNKKA